MENDKLPPNDPLYGIWEKLDPEHQTWFSANRQKALDEAKKERDDHFTNRNQQIDAKAKFFVEDYKRNLTIKRPIGVPPPRLKTRVDAEYEIDKAHHDRLDRLVVAGRKAEREYLRDTVGIERRGPSDRDHGIDRT